MSMSIDPVAVELLRSELQEGERLLWSGRPDTRRLLVRSDAFLVPFSLMWAGFTIFWEAGVLTAKTTSGGDRYGLFFVLWGLPFVAIGLYLVVGRLVARRYFGPRTAYAITDRRAIVLKPARGGRRNVTSVWLASAPAVSRRAAAKGHGTVLIGSMPVSQMAAVAGDPGWVFNHTIGDAVVAFWNISDADEVGRLATRLISEART
jgi:hypothetical protein